MAIADLNAKNNGTTMVGADIVEITSLGARKKNNASCCSSSERKRDRSCMLARAAGIKVFSPFFFSFSFFLLLLLLLLQLIVVTLNCADIHEFMLLFKMSFLLTRV